MDGVDVMKAPERIWAKDWVQGFRGKIGTWATHNDEGDRVEFVRADLAQAPAPVRVRKLEWYDAGFEQCASSVAGFYRVFERDGLWRAVVHTRADAHFIAETETEDAAKARAQADNEARVLAALEAPDAGVVAELVEALRGLLALLDAGSLYEPQAYRARALIAKLESRA